MKRLVFIFCCFSLIKTAEAQNQKEYNFKNLTGNGEVFYDNILDEIQNNKLNLSDTTFWYLDSAIAFYSAKKNTCKLSHAYAVKGKMHYNLSRSDSATINFIKASKLIKNNCPDLDKYYFYNSWSLLAKSIKDYANSDSLNGLAYNAALTIDDKTYLLNVLINKSILYSEQNNYKDAISVIKDVGKKADAYKLEFQKLVSLQNLGAYYIDLELYDSALFVYDQLKNSINEETTPRVIMDLNNNIGLIYFNQGNYKQADIHYKKAIDLARENKEQNVLAIYLKNYSDLKYQLGDYKASKDYLAEYIKLKNALFSSEKFEILKDLETQYKTAKQREKILELEKSSLEQSLEIQRKNVNRNYMFFALIGMLIILIAVYSRLNYVRKSKSIVEREKKRSDDLLLNILPEEVAEELKQTGESEAKYFENVTVLFTDFKDFTSASETMQAKELVEEVNFFFKSFDEIVTDFNIEKIKTIGDSYMAACGIPLSNKNSTLTMLNAAFKMLEVAESRNAENKEQGKPQFEMRIGMHTGPIVAGIVGVKKFQYDIWGDTVNIASRMESYSEVGRINVSKYAYEILKNEPGLVFENRGIIDVKGKGKMEMYYVSRA